jgi:DNA-binding MarR family transcriptional regulator
MHQTQAQIIAQWSQVMRRMQRLQPRPFVMCDELTHAESMALHMIYQELQASPGALVRPMDLARNLRISRSALSQVLKALTAKGFVERQRNIADSRAVAITLTPAGTAAAAQINQACCTEISQLIDYVGTQKFSAMVEAMSLACDYLERKVDAPSGADAPGVNSRVSAVPETERSEVEGVAETETGIRDTGGMRSAAGAEKCVTGAPAPASDTFANKAPASDTFGNAKTGARMGGDAK